MASRREDRFTSFWRASAMRSLKGFLLSPSLVDVVEVAERAELKADEREDGLSLVEVRVILDL